MSIIDKYDGVTYKVCLDCGVLVQTHRDHDFEYDHQYFQHYKDLDNTPIEKNLNKGRVDLVTSFECCTVLDIGIGSGIFIKRFLDRERHHKAYGYDVNMDAIDWLVSKGYYWDPYKGIPDYVQAITFWDVLEHLPHPDILLALIPQDVYVFVSIPIFDDIKKAMLSKHFKPNEHLFYFTETGFVNYMESLEFICMGVSDFETRAGREGIRTFVFQK